MSGGCSRLPFDSLGIKKLPTIAALKQEYDALAAEKRKLYTGYREIKANMQELLVAKGNAERLLGIKKNEQDRDVSRRQQRGETPNT